MGGEIGITVTHNIITCSLCNRTYSVLSTSLHTCPYCQLSFYTKDIIEQKKINSELRKDIKLLKRSNASLKGVITKLRNRENQALLSQKCGPDQYEVDLCDVKNYIFIQRPKGVCEDCEYPQDEYAACMPHSMHQCDINEIPVLKPNIKSDLESGKAVAKGGKIRSSKLGTK